METGFHELKSRNVQHRACISENMLPMHKRKFFLHHITISGKDWIHYGNLKKRKSWKTRGYTSKLRAKPNIYGTNSCCVVNEVSLVV